MIGLERVECMKRRQYLRFYLLKKVVRSPGGIQVPKSLSVEITAVSEIQVLMHLKKRDGKPSDRPDLSTRPVDQDRPCNVVDRLVIEPDSPEHEPGMFFDRWLHELAE